MSEDFALPMFVGEYGVIRNANTDGQGPDIFVNEDQRGNWTGFVKNQSVSRDMDQCFFDYATSFAAFDVVAESWIPQIIASLFD